MMDELELISRLREEVPLGSADEAEHAFLTSIQGSVARPARFRGPLRFPARIVQARHGAPRLARRWWLPALPGSPPAGRPATRRRTVVITIAAAAAAGLAAVTGVTLLPEITSLPRPTPLPKSISMPQNTSQPTNTSLPENTSGASPAAAQLLAKIAAAAAAQPSPPVRDSQFLYIETWGAGSVCKTGTAADPWNCVPGKPDEVQSWYSVSSVCVTDAFRKDGKMTQFNYAAMVSNPKQLPCGGDMYYPTYRFLQALPTDPHALLNVIRQQTKGAKAAGRSGLYWTFFTIGTLLESAPPPSATAALYRAAALIRGVTVVPDATDTIGRPGVSVAFTYQGMRTEWIFNKQTLQYLGSREVGVADGTLISQTTIQQHAIVDHAGQVPG